MAQAWMGGASHAAMQDSSSDTEMSEAESESEEEGLSDDEGSPRGTKGRDTYAFASPTPAVFQNPRKGLQNPVLSAPACNCMAVY